MFVNMTAAWCVTCLVNERVAISSDAVHRAFADRHVAYLKGDWTRQDPQITEFLRENGREGVPLYVYYPRHGQPTVLPQILTEIHAAERAGTRLTTDPPKVVRKIPVETPEPPPRQPPSTRSLPTPIATVNLEFTSHSAALPSEVGLRPPLLSRS